MNTVGKLLIAVVILFGAGTASWGFFTDSFDGPGLDVRWVSDNSPANIVGSNIVITAGQAVGVGCKENLYNHLETPIAVLESFEVQVDAQVNQAQTWGAALAVYWDATHFMVLKAPKNSKFRSEVYDGANFTSTNSTLTYLGGQMATLRIEFTAESIRFYAKNAGDGQLTHLANLELPRAAWTLPSDALMIIGKGRQDNTLYTQPDYDNDYNFAGATDVIVLDNARYEGVLTCGDPGTEYLAADMDNNCYVDLGDWAKVLSQWLWCTDMINPDCDGYWQSGDFNPWQIDPYLQINATAAPAAGTQPLESFDIQMAQSEYRDAVFMLGPYGGGDRNFRLEVETSDGLAPDSILIQQAYYLQMRYSTGPIADPIYTLSNGGLTVPYGESRQIWLRFDARNSAITPGNYTFALIITDLDTQQRQVIPGTVTVWDFVLPDNVLPNNTYAQLAESQFGGPALNGAVAHMRYYGLNMVNIHPTHDPKAVTVDDFGNIITFNDSDFRWCVQPVIQAWQGAQGNENLMFFFQMPALDLGMTRTDIVYGTALWDTVFHNWIDMFVATIESMGLAYDDWIMTITDEEDATTLMNHTIPLAEKIKAIDSNIRMVCNSSAKLIYESWKNRYFSAFDFFQPHLNLHVDSDPTLINWLKTSGKPIWSYRCFGGYGGGWIDGYYYDPAWYQYQYYRTYAWLMLKHDITGIGLWTYCVLQGSGSDPWNTNDNLGYVLVYKHWATNDIVHARRYEMYRQTMDDYRYVCKLREVAAAIGPAAQADAEALISDAIADITADYSDTTRCDQWRDIIAEEILNFGSYQNREDFEDNFTYTGNPTPLNARWTSDNSPGNPAGSNLAIVNWGDGVAQSGAPLDNLYNHLQTPIDATGSFEVESNMRGNNPSSWAPSLMVYWDVSHWIRFAQFGNFGLMYNDGSGPYNVTSSASCGGWSFYTQRIEFTESTIKFYGGIGASPGEPAIEPTYIPEFDLPRAAWTQQPGALLIVGKGYQGWGFNNPDFDNDYGDPGAADYLGIDRVAYRSLPDSGGGFTCGDAGTFLLEADLNVDCYVNLADVAELAGQWMWCTDPANGECDLYWK